MLLQNYMFTLICCNHLYTSVQWLGKETFIHPNVCGSSCVGKHPAESRSVRLWGPWLWGWIWLLTPPLQMSKLKGISPQESIYHIHILIQSFSLTHWALLSLREIHVYTWTDTGLSVFQVYIHSEGLNRFRRSLWKSEAVLSNKQHQMWLMVCAILRANTENLVFVA